MDIRLTYSDIGAEGPAQFPSVEWEEPLGRHRIAIRSGAYCRFDSQPTNYPHLHRNYWEFCLIVEGEGLYQHGKERIVLHRAMVTVADRDVLHEISSHGTRDLFLVFFTLRVKKLPLSLSNRYEDALIERFLLAHEISIGGQDHLLAYLPLFDDVGPSTHAAKHRQHQLLRLLALECVAALTPSGVAFTLPSAPRSLLERASEFIDKNSHRSIDVGEVAASVGCSERQLRRLFRDSRGTTIVEAINERRLNLAVQHLLMNFSVGQAARAVGVSSTAQFCRMFRARYGMAPRAYQALHLSPGEIPQTIHTPDLSKRRRPKTDPGKGRSRTKRGATAVVPGRAR